ncbi:MAG: cell division protein FtsZ [Deltaproteobacteria bacterium]|nr:cell division protein FtsZ [Deltaproteobacteria bacterium]
MSFRYVENEKSAKIKVIGVGGAGGNAVNNMIGANLTGVQFITANTDSQALEISKAPVKVQIGGTLTEGLGAGAEPDVGKNAALESKKEIEEAIGNNVHMVFITAGFGGGTGTGAAPVIAEICKELGILTVAVITKPFKFEGKKRMQKAEEGIRTLKDVTDTVITIPNDRLRGLASKNATLIEMFSQADEILLHSVKGITDLIMLPGLVNLDFADVRTTMNRAGMAIMGIGRAGGENRAIEAAEKAISHPLLEDISIANAKGVLMNISSTSSLTMQEMSEASDRIYKEVGDKADIIWGAVMDETMGDEVSVTVIATGINSGFDNEDYQKSDKVKPILSAGQRTEKPEAEHYKKSEGEQETPAYIRKLKTSENNQKSGYKGIYTQGEDINEDELDIPTFLRKKAD